MDAILKNSMLPTKVITGENQAKYGGGGSRIKPSSFTFNNVTNNNHNNNNNTCPGFADLDESSNHNSSDIHSLHYSQPRTVPSTVEHFPPGIQSANQASRLGSLSFLKFGSKPSRSFSTKSNPSTPKKASRAAARHSLHISAIRSSRDTHHRSSSHAAEATDHYRLPQPPVSPTFSLDSTSPARSSADDPFSGNNRSPSMHTGHVFDEKMSKTVHAHKRTHLDEEYDYDDADASYQYRDAPKSHDPFDAEEYQFKRYVDEEDEDVVRLSSVDVMLNNEGFYLIDKDSSNKQTPSLLERRKQGPIRPLHSINNSLSRRPIGRFNAPISPPLSEPSMLNSRSTSIASISDDCFSNGLEVEEKSGQSYVPEILRSRLPAIATARDTAPIYCSNKHNNNVAVMDNMNMESLEELQVLMSDMNCIDRDGSGEVQLLMSQMTQGQDVVRRPEEIPDNEPIRSPQSPPPECACRHSPKTPTRRVSRSMINTLHTASNEEIDDEMAKELQQLMEELSYTPVKITPSPVGAEEAFRVRSMAESEGLNEMPSEIETESSLLTLDNLSILPPISASNEEYGLGQGLDFSDLDDISDMLEEEIMEFELRQKERRLVMQDNLKAVADFDALRLDTSQLRLSEVTPDTSPIDLLSSTVRATSSSSNKSELSGTTAALSGGSRSLRDKARKHNLKENEIRVEDPAYLVAFKSFLRSAVHSDAFVSKQPRFDAVQTRRICNETSHEYRPLPPPPFEMTEAPSVQDPSLPVRKLLTPEERRVKQVTEEITTRLWVFAASRWLNYGRLLTSPAHELLYQSSLSEQRRPKQRSMSVMSTKSGTRRKVLDLGGAPVADWGWHCAYEYPHSKVYTVTSRPKNINIDNVEITGAGIIEKRRFRGPSNHRHIKVSSLWHLPFPDNHFDVISARSLHTILKQQPPARRPRAQTDKPGRKRMDEYALTVRECYRVLKPGGHFEFNLMDADILNAGPATKELCGRFEADLKEHGYDPNPTTRWLSRLDRAGFQDVQRTWTLVPMTPPSARPVPPPKRDLSQSPANDLQKAEEEMRQELEKLSEKPIAKGSTKDVACISGLVGNWRWEEWMIKLDGERASPEGKRGLVKGISPVLEEGRENNSAWRQLVGWAKKPTKREKALRM